INASDFLFEDNLKTLIAPAQRPIIRLPQYIEMYGAICDDSCAPNSGNFKSSPRLLPIATSTPTYVKIANIPKTSCGYAIAPQPSLLVRAREYANKSPPTTTSSAPDSQYILLRSSGSRSSLTLVSLATIDSLIRVSSSDGLGYRVTARSVLIWVISLFS